MKQVNYRDLLILIHPYRAKYTKGVIYAMLSGIFAFLVPLIGKTAIDGIMNNEMAELPEIAMLLIRFWGGSSVLAQHLWLAGILLIIINSLSGLFLYLRDRITSIASESIARDLRNRLYDHLHHVPAAFHTKADTGDLIQRCSSDVETVRIFLSKQIVAIGRSVILLLLAIPMMIRLNIFMTFVSLAMIPAVITFSVIFFKKVRRTFLRVDEAEGALTTVIQENLTGIRVVRAFAQQDFECDKFKSSNARYKTREFQLVKILAWFWGITDMLCLGQITLVIFIGGWMVSYQAISVGMLFAFMSYSSMVIWPIRHMGRILADTGKALVAYGRICEILDEPVESDEVDHPIDFPERTRGNIQFREVSFSYQSDQPTIRHLNFKVSAGETIAIVGPTGSGKSTLIKLLLRLYDYQKGSITIDGFELNRIKRKVIRGQIGTALQEPFLFARTLRDNIKLSKIGASDRSMESAAKAACIHDSIMDFQQGYDTVIGEKGVTLSGGQAQRVTLSRTFLKNAPILILDDSLSAVDAGTEQLILDMLDQRHGKNTTLIVTHRLSCCIRADRVLVMGNGSLIQEGTHETLITKPGFYQNVWQIQHSFDQELDRESVIH